MPRRSNSLAGIQNLVNGNPSFGADPNADPLGIRVQRRGMDSYLSGIADEARNGAGFSGGVVPSMDQAGFQQVLAEKQAKVAPDDTSLTREVAQNPAGQTDEATNANVASFTKGGALPDWYGGATPETQDAFRRRVLQGIRRASQRG